MNRLLEAATWQVMLDRHGNLFGDLRTGSRIGIARHADVVAREADIIVLEARKGKLIAFQQPFEGFDDPCLDIMLVGDDEALDEVSRHVEGDALAAIKQQIRVGWFACYLMRVQCDLIEAGYENVLAAFGVPFLGACR
jgi:hypothetical protein